MATAPLPLSDIITVNVSAAVSAVVPRNFNQGLIVGSSTVIPSYGANPRLRQFASTTAMLTAGFISSDPEFIAATLYFEQSPAPQFVWIGRQDLTSIQTLIPHSGAAGTGYKVGDVVGITQGGASNGFAEVTTIGGGGAVTGLSKIAGQQGTGYAIATDLTTTGGSGTGLAVDITAVGDTLADAVQACMLTNQNWYGFMGCGAVDADHTALAALSTANWQTMFYFGATSDAAVAAGTPGNIALTLQSNKQIDFLLYSTTQSGAAPNNAFAAAAALGVYCGLDTGLAGSYFTLAFKSLVGVTPEPINQTQYTAIIGANCNVYTNFGAFTGVLYTGVASSGLFFDEYLFRATLINLIQVDLMNLLIASPAVPLTDAGEHQLIAQVQAACLAMVTIGFLAGGIYTGAPLLNLKTGQALEEGFYVQAQSFALASSSQLAARQAMPIFATILEAGAAQQVTVQINVQQ